MVAGENGRPRGTRWHRDRGVAARLAGFYVVYFLVMGIQLPFWPVWLEAQGLGPGEIGVLVSVGAWVRVANPLVAHVADRRGERRRIMMWLAWASALAFALFAVGARFWWLLFVSVLFGAFFSPLLALGESLTLIATGRHGLHYGRIRLWGSLSFVVAASAGGQLIEGRSPSTVLVIISGTLLLQAVTIHALPDTRPDERHTAAQLPATRLLSHPRFLIFLGATSLVLASHATYYGFGTLHWIRAGHREGVIGSLWAEGVIAEIVLFACVPAVMRRFRATSLIAIGGLAGVVRWTVTAATADVVVLALVQPLHALTYGATHLGAMRLIAESVRPRVSATAQSLYAGLANGAAMGLSLLLAGALYERWAGNAFWAMAALAAGGALLALRLHRRGVPNFG